MSRVGKHPIPLPEGVSVERAGREFTVKGAKGALSLTLADEVELHEQDGALAIAPRDSTQRARAMWGLQRSLVANMVEGVSRGFTVTLEISGVGYRAAMQGDALQLQLGYSHDVTYPVPDGIEIQCPTQTQIAVSGIDRQRVGQVAAELRAFRPPEPYKGKGIRYQAETIVRKEGKKK